MFALSASAQVSIDVNLSQRGINISPTHYGIFFEDINHAADGGLYAELIRNRSFEEDGPHPGQRARRTAAGNAPEGAGAAAEERRHSNVMAWRTVGEGTEMSLTEKNLLNANQKHALQVSVTSPRGGVQNEGFWGIHAVRGTQYHLTFWARAVKGKPGAITASLVDGEGNDLGSAVIRESVSGSWKKYEATIVATGETDRASFRLSVERPCQMALDVVSLFPPTYKGRPNGCRPHLAQMLADMHPRFMRFPGGCYVEGEADPANAFHWERTVGPIEQRPGHYDANWRYWTTDGMGFHEFLQLSEDIGAKPLYVVNVGIWHGGCDPVDEIDGTWLQECLDALEYANGDITTKYGRMRAENGHPEPFNIEYLEIGNENANFHFDNNQDQSDHYFERYHKFYQAIKARYPNIQCIGNVQSWGTDTPSWRSKEPVDLLDEHYYRNPSWFADAYHKYDGYDRKGPGIYVGEYAVTSQAGRTGNMNAALGEAVYMLGMENNSDIVRLNSYAPIFVNENAVNWAPDMIRFNSAKAFGTPSYWVQQLFPSHLGNVLVDSKMEWKLPESLPTTATVPMQVGVATWNTNSSYRDPQLIVDGQPVELPAINEWQKLNRTPAHRPGGPNYVPALRQWNVEEGMVTSQGSGEGLRWMCPVQIPAGKPYTYRVRARKNSGAEGFLVVFNYQNDKEFDWFNVGGWNNTQNNIEQTVDGGKMTVTSGMNYRVNTDQWYDLEVRADGDSMFCYVDGKLQFATLHRNANMRGVYSNATLDEATNTLYVKVVNVGDTGTTGTLNLENGAAATAEMVRLSSESGQDENTMQYPQNIVPRSARVDVDGSGQRITFPVAPFSVNIITLRLK